MSLSLGTDWLAAASASTVEPRILVRVWYALGQSYRFLSGRCPSMTYYPVSVLNVAPVDRSFDAWERKQSVGGLTVTLRRCDLVEAMINNYVLKGTTVNVYMGFPDLSEGDFEDYACGIIDDVYPDVNEVRIVIRSAKTFLENKIVGSWPNKHPLEIAEDTLDKCGVPSNLYDATSLDPATYTTTHSHWVVDRSSGGIDDGGRALTQPTRGLNILGEIAQMVNGGFYVRENGQIEFVPFDASAAVVDSWTARDLLAPPVTKSIYSRVCNKVSVTTHPLKFKDLSNLEDIQRIFVIEDSNSQALFSNSDATSHVHNTYAKSIDAPWVAGTARLKNDITNVATTFVIGAAKLYAICGTRWDGFPAGSQDADAQASAGRLVYLLIDREIVSINSLTLDTTAVWTAFSPAESGIGALKSDHALPMVGTVAGASRGLFGTSAVAHDALAEVYDITIPIAMAQARLTRWRNGTPELEVKTSFAKYGVQLGDLVDLTLDGGYFRMYGVSSLTSAIKWEVTGKKPDLFGSEPGVVWSLTMASNSGAAAESNAYDISAPTSPSLLRKRVRGLVRDTFADCTVRDGFGYSNSGLNLTVQSGTVTSGDVIGVLEENYTRTLTASVTTWITYSIGDDAVLFRESGTEPSIENNEAWLWKIVTDGSGVTSATDLRTLKQGLSTTLLNTECIAPSKVSLVSETQNIIPNGEFTAWSAPFDDMTTYPPDQWVKGYATSGTPYTWTDDDTIDWAATAVNESIYFSQLASRTRTGDTVVRYDRHRASPVPLSVGLAMKDMVPVTEGNIYLIHSLWYTETTTARPRMITSFYQEDKSTLVATYITPLTAGPAFGFLDLQQYLRVPTNGRYMRVMTFRDNGYGSNDAQYVDYVRACKTTAEFFAYRASARSLASAAWTDIQATSIPTDAFGNSLNYGTAYQVGSYYLYVQRPSVWQFTARIKFTGLPIGGYIKLALYLNGAPGVGTEVTGQIFRNDTGSGPLDGELSLGVDSIALSAGDTVGCYAYNSSGSSVPLVVATQYDSCFQGQEKKEQ